MMHIYACIQDTHIYMIGVQVYIYRVMNKDGTQNNL